MDDTFFKKYKEITTKIINSLPITSNMFDLRVSKYLPIDFLKDSDTKRDFDNNYKRIAFGYIADIYRFNIPDTIKRFERDCWFKVKLVYMDEMHQADLFCEGEWIWSHHIQNIGQLEVDRAVPVPLTRQRARMFRGGLVNMTPKFMGEIVKGRNRRTFSFILKRWCQSTREWVKVNTKVYRYKYNKWKDIYFLCDLDDVFRRMPEIPPIYGEDGEKYSCYPGDCIGPDDLFQQGDAGGAAAGAPLAPSRSAVKSSASWRRWSWWC